MLVWEIMIDGESYYNVHEGGNNLDRMSLQELKKSGELIQVARTTCKARPHACIEKTGGTKSTVQGMAIKC